jgi:hypothetical protein
VAQREVGHLAFDAALVATLAARGEPLLGDLVQQAGQRGATRRPLAAADALATMLGVAPSRKIAALVAVGYADEQPESTPRKPAAVVMRWVEGGDKEGRMKDEDVIQNSDFERRKAEDRKLKGARNWIA